MRKFELKEFIKACGGTLFSEIETNFLGIGTDTRKNLEGYIFIALKGDNYDAHDYLDKAVGAGARALVISSTYLKNHSETIQRLSQQVTLIEVEDTLLALQKVGTYCRYQSKAKIVGITGSNGKTTSKEFAASILSRFRKVHYSVGSFNNHWGVPFTLIQIPDDCEVAIVEMGMNHAGEIENLVKMADPDVVVCTMVGRAHIEFFGSVEKIAQAKEEIYLYSSEKAIRLFNLDNEYTRQMQKRSAEKFPSSRQLTLSSSNSKADVFLKIRQVDVDQLTIEGSIAGEIGSAVVPVFGVQNLTNLLVAAGSALAIGLQPKEIWEGLSFCRTNWGRNQFVTLKSGAKAIFDAYNANPDSMVVLLENVKNLQLKKSHPSAQLFGVFGQMLELGEVSESSHFELGQIAGNLDFDHIYFVGDKVAGDSFRSGLESAKYQKKLVISDIYKESLANEMSSMLKINDLVIFKGSRGMKLEKFLMACDPLNFNLNKESTI